MSGKEITINGKDGNFQGYLASPASNKGGGVIVIQEIFGINKWMRQITDYFASQGYFALAPDLFWRLQPGIQLDPTVPEQFQKGLEYYGKLNVDKAVEDIQTSINTLKQVPGCNGNVGTTGFCLGGTLTYLSACRTDGKAHSSYYGVGIDQMLGERSKIKTPTIFHIAGKDAFVPPHAQAAIRDAFATEKEKNIHVYVYDDADHGFARETDPSHYSPAAAKLAHQRTLELFKSNLA